MAHKPRPRKPDPTRNDRRFRIAVHVLVVLLLAPFAGLRAQAADPALSTQQWLDDFAQLRREMSDHYANLEWAVERRGLDLPRLAADTEMRLRAARTDADARATLTAFLRAFGDGHLGVRWPAPAPAAAVAPASARDADRPGVCASKGYRSAAWPPGVAFSRLAGYRSLTGAASRYFPAGLLRVGRSAIGILRIGLFSERSFPELCEEAARQLGVPPEGPCEDGCAGPLERETANLLTRRLEEQVRALRAAGAGAILVDLTDNGGGSDWVRAAARMLTPVRLREPRQGFVRHPHWAGQFRDRIEQVDNDLRTAAPRDRPLLMRARAGFAAALAAAEVRCDRSTLWSGGRPTCSQVSDAGPFFGSGALSYLAREDLPRDVLCCYLFGALRYTYREGFHAGPLIVLVDRETASAAEYFAALLQDNGAATILGEPTYGAGCGYTNGGIATVLDHSRAEIHMPDCLRYRADGTNEVEGITPDALVPWRGNDSALQRARRVAEALPDALRHRH